MLYTFGTTKIGGKEYTCADLRTGKGNLRRPQEFGVTSMHGGRVAFVGETNSDVLLLIEQRDGLKVIDLAAERLDDIPVGILRNLCDKRKLKYTPKTTKDELLVMLGAKEGEPGGEGKKQE